MERLKNLLAPTLAGAVAMWLLAGVWHMALAAHFYGDHLQAHHDGLGVIFVAYVVLALLMAALHQRMPAASRPVRAGLVLGAIVGVLWVFPHGLVMVGAHGGPLDYLLGNTVWHLIEQGVGGAAIAAVAARLTHRELPATVSR